MSFNIKKFLNFGNLFKKKKSAGAGGEQTLAMPDFGDDLPDLDSGDSMSQVAGENVTLESDAPAEKIKIKLKKPGAPGRGKALKILLLLVILGGGGYYAVSNDLVDAKPVMDMARPYLELAGLVEPRPMPAPTTKPTRTKARTAAKPGKTRAAANKPQAGAAKPAAAAVVGTISGQPFKPDSIEYSRGYLVLREGPKAAPKHEIRLVVPHESWELPANKDFESGMFSSAEISLIANSSESRLLSNGIDMKLKFGAATGNTVTGTVKLESKDHHLAINGSFKASVSGFRTVNGEPVLTSDANETLMVVALKHLITREPDKAISNVAYRDARFTPANKPRSGSLVMEYAVNNKDVSRNFQFKKTKKGWKVSKMSAEK